MAVLTLGEAGEILSARGDCLVVFGLECAALPRQNIGAFLDARYVFPQETRNYGLGRFGLRFAF